MIMNIPMLICDDQWLETRAQPGWAKEAEAPFPFSKIKVEKKDKKFNF